MPGDPLRAGTGMPCGLLEANDGTFCQAAGSAGQPLNAASRRGSAWQLSGSPQRCVAPPQAR